MKACKRDCRKIADSISRQPLTGESPVPDRLTPGQSGEDIRCTDFNRTGEIFPAKRGCCGMGDSSGGFLPAAAAVRGLAFPFLLFFLLRKRHEDLHNPVLLDALYL